MLVKLAGFDAQVEGEVVDVAANEEGAVVQPMIAPFGKGVAAEFASVGQQVVSAAYLGFDAEVL